MLPYMKGKLECRSIQQREEKMSLHVYFMQYLYLLYMYLCVVFTDLSRKASLEDESNLYKWWREQLYWLEYAWSCQWGLEFITEFGLLVSMLLQMYFRFFWGLPKAFRYFSVACFFAGDPLWSLVQTREQQCRLHPHQLLTGCRRCSSVLWVCSGNS